MSHARITHYILRLPSSILHLASCVVRPFLPCLLIFTILVPTLDAQSLWWDEGISLHLATSSWAEIVADRAANIHPPLYFFALKLWIGLAGHTPFAARYLSALAATLLPAVAYAFVRRRVDRRAGRAAALLLSLATPFIIYGQEVRAYAFLPLLALALLAQLWPARDQLRTQILADSRTLLSSFLRLAVIQAAFVLTHYAGVIAVAWANFVLLFRLMRGKDRRAWGQWLLSVGLTALLALPWMVAVLLAGAAGLKTQAGLGNALAEPVPPVYLARLLGIFHTVGLPEALKDRLLVRPSVLVGVLLLVALSWQCLGWGKARLGKGRRDLAWRAVKARPTKRGHFLAAWLLPLWSAALMWIFSPQSHPRYVLPFVVAGWLLAATLITAPDIPRLLRGALLAALLMTCLLGLRAYLTNPLYARSDIRGVAAFIRAEAQPDDVALAPPTDWSLEQYDVGAARLITLPSPADEGGVVTLIAGTIQPNSRVYLLDYRRNALDPRGQVRTILAWGGWFERQVDFHGAFVERYAVSTPSSLPACTPFPPTCVEGRSPCLIGATFHPTPMSGAALPVILCWDGVAGSKRYAVGLRLYAPSGALIAGVDTLLLDTALRPTELWSGEPVTTYHRFPLPAGLLPRLYRLEVGTYATEEANTPLSLVREGMQPLPSLVLGTITPLITPWVDETPPVLEEIATLPTLRLQRALLHSQTVYPGQKLYVTLHWQLTGDGNREPLWLVLRQEERDLASVALLADLPPLPEGRPLLEHSALTIPPDAHDGPATVWLMAGAQPIALGTVTVQGGAHSFIVPPVTYPVTARVGDVATLVGVDITPGLTLRSGEPFTVTLIWQAAATQADLTVFTHLIGEDCNIVAQHDGKPVEGQRPTAGWVAGEILSDPHKLIWQRDDYTGPAILRLGLYDALTGRRIIWANGEDAWTFAEPLEVR